MTRAKEVATRQRYVRLVDGVREAAGVVRIFSSLHVSGERESRVIPFLYIPLHLTNICLGEKREIIRTAAYCVMYPSYVHTRFPSLL